MKSKSILLLVITYLVACSPINKKSQESEVADKNIKRHSITREKQSHEAIQRNAMLKDSLNYIFDRLLYYKNIYANHLNEEENYPNLLQKVENLKSKTDADYFSEIEKLITLFATEKDYKSHVTDSLSNVIINKIYTNDELAEIRFLYNSNYTLDRNQAPKKTLDQLVNRYNRINHYFKEQYYFRDSLRKKFWKLCPKYFEIRREIARAKQPQIDSIKQTLKSRQISFDQNRSFVNSLIHEEKADSVLPSYAKNIASVFEPFNNSYGVYGLDPNRYGDKILFNQSSLPHILKEKMYVKNIIQDTLPTNQREPIKIYAYSPNGRTEVRTKKIGYKQEMCGDSYYFYELDSSSKREERYLITSTYKLNLEYKNYPTVDSLIAKQNVSICSDCPSGWSKQKTYAKLNGYENLYLTATSNKAGVYDDTDTYLRAVYYVGENQIFAIWSEEYDAFGCGCV
jgi:hypothetical protein